MLAEIYGMMPSARIHEHVVDAEEGVLQLSELLPQRAHIQARNRDVRSQTVDEENEQREKDFVLQLRNPE